MIDGNYGGSLEEYVAQNSVDTVGCSGLNFSYGQDSTETRYWTDSSRSFVCLDGLYQEIKTHTEYDTLFSQELSKPDTIFIDTGSDFREETTEYHFYFEDEILHIYDKNLDGILNDGDAMDEVHPHHIRAYDILEGKLILKTYGK